jgi:hypothetical protein
MEEKWESFRSGWVKWGWLGAGFSKSDVCNSGVLEKGVEAVAGRPLFPTAPTGDVKEAVQGSVFV